MPRELKPCGTVAAYMRHRRHGEEICDACRQAATEYAREQRGYQPRHAAECGTNSGATGHRRRGEALCEPCRAARNAYERDLRAVRKARKVGAS